MNEAQLSTVPEVFPTIIVGLEYGNKVTNLDVDIVKVTDLLRDGGVSDEDIMNLTIHISGGAPEQSNHGKEFSTQGYYRHKERLIRLFNATQSNDFIEFEKTLKDSGTYNAWTESFFADFASREMNETLLHELDHVAAKYSESMQREELDYRTKKKLEYQHVAGITLRGLVPKVASIGFLYASSSHLLESITGDENFASDTAWSIAYFGAMSLFLATSLRLKRAIKDDALDNYLNDPVEARAREAQEQDLQLLTVQWKQDYSVTQS